MKKLEANIVCIGGGTGLPNLLRGLKKYSSNITAIVTVADDGGSSGVIRDELKILPPGDIKNCLLALADTEPLMEKLFQYRFKSGSLKGHSFGNLYLAAMTGILGDFELAIKESSKILAVRGRVVPSTLADVRIEAEYCDGSKVLGESKIPGVNRKIKKIRLYPPDAEPLDEALDAISNAEVIIIGPGSLYTSIIPNLLIKPLTECISASSAKKIFIVNIMTQPGETSGYTAFDHVKAVIKHSNEDIIQYVVVNTEQIPKHLLDIYRADGSTPVLCDNEKIKKMGYNVVEGHVIDPTNVLRHSPSKLANVLMSIIE